MHLEKPPISVGYQVTEKAGNAAVTEGEVIAKERLPKEASIFTAELYALNAALRWIEEREVPGLSIPSSLTLIAQ